MNATTAWSEGDPCELCGEDGTPDDPVAHFRSDADGGDGGYVMAHGQCGEDAGLRLA